MGLFERIFKGKLKEEPGAQRADIMSGRAAIFTPWSGDAYSNDIYRSAVDAIARNGAKLKGSHVLRYGDHTKLDANCKLNRLLQTQPNPYMSAFDMQYRLITHYFIYNNAFAFLQRDERGNVTGIYPMRPQSIDFLVDALGTLYCRFIFGNGKETILDYADVLHFRRNFNSDDFVGDPNTALSAVLELAHTQTEGMVNSIQAAANIRGILKYSQIMAPEKLKAEKDAFIQDYLQISNSGGIIVMDQKTEYVPLTMNPATIDEKQIKAIQTKIFSYLGIHENIVNSNYTEDEWAAFYESIIEPLAVQWSLEYTRKIFNDREQAFGNAVIFDSGRLQFSSNKTKVDLISKIMPYGLLTLNQALEILNLPSVADGDKRLQTLNVVDAAQANKYQVEGE